MWPRVSFSSVSRAALLLRLLCLLLLAAVCCFAFLPLLTCLVASAQGPKKDASQEVALQREWLCLAGAHGPVHLPVQRVTGLQPDLPGGISCHERFWMYMGEL